MDAAFARQHRGVQTARIEMYPLHGDLWFVVRHGDLFTRTPRVQSRRTEVLYFRPEKDDVVVYCPRHDEIRINARNRWERRLYREEFGRCLRGDPGYFAERQTYTLEPLRDDGPEALDPAGLERIRKISLCELEIAWDHAGREVVFRDADDLFRGVGGSEEEAGPIPAAGRLARAAFELQFDDSPRPRPVQIRPPNILKLGRHCDLQLVDEWLCRRGFRVRV